MFGGGRGENNGVDAAAAMRAVVLINSRRGISWEEMFVFIISTF